MIKKHLRDSQRYSIITSDLTHCIVCGSYYAINKHEVFFGKNRQNSIDNGLVIPLCLNHHNMIHNNIELDAYWKRIAQQKFEEEHSRDEFMNIFKKNYL